MRKATDSSRLSSVKDIRTPRVVSSIMLMKYHTQGLASSHLLNSTAIMTFIVWANIAEKPCLEMSCCGTYEEKDKPGAGDGFTRALV